MSEMKRLEFLLREGKITRRDFLARLSALGVAVTLSPTLWSTPTYAAIPQKGGHFKIAMADGATTDTIDPSILTNLFTHALSYAVFNRLVEIDENGLAQPELAESIDYSGARVWVVKLRKGIEFHNGKTMTVEDVIASYNYHIGIDSKSTGRSLLKQVETIKADGKHTVIFELKAANVDFPYVMADMHFVIMPSENGKVIDPLSGVGTGGYILKAFEPGISAVLERNKNYYRSGRAHFDSVEMLVIHDQTARTNAMSTGLVNAMHQCDVKTVHLLKNNKDLIVHSITGAMHSTMIMDTTKAPFNDNNIRMALKHAIDRDQIVNTVLRGYGRVANDHPIGPANRYCYKELPQRTYDSDKAQFYLKKSGLSSLKVDLSTADVAPGGIDAALLFKETAAKCGIEINVVREPNDGYWSSVWMKKAFCMGYWSGRPTEDSMFSIAYAGDSEYNESHWQNERFNKLLIDARAELDSNKRSAMYHEMQQILSDEGGTIIPFFMDFVFATQKNVHHGQMANNWDLDGGRFLERWWFA